MPRQFKFEILDPFIAGLLHDRGWHIEIQSIDRLRRDFRFGVFRRWQCRRHWLERYLKIQILEIATSSDGFDMLLPQGLGIDQLGRHGLVNDGLGHWQRFLFLRHKIRRWHYLRRKLGCHLGRRGGREGFLLVVKRILGINRGT